jgi:hypothetical protein
MLLLSWRHQSPDGHYPVEDFPQEDWDPGKTQYSFKATSSDSPNLRRDLTQPFKSGFFFIRRLKWQDRFSVAQASLQAVEWSCPGKKIWLLHSFPR